jgi:hypothetical protein
MSRPDANPGVANGIGTKQKPNCDPPTAGQRYPEHERSLAMLWTLVVILLALWLLGVVTSYTAGGLIHILLLVAIVVVVIRLLQGRRPLV